MSNVFVERHERLEGLSSNSYFSPRPNSMILEFKLKDSIIGTLKAAVQRYICNCLEAYHAREFNNSGSIEAFTDQYEEEISKLPNITPNGLVLCKREVVPSYNNILQEVTSTIGYLGLDKSCEKIHCPINVRLKSGQPSEYQLNRPYASTKWHSDIWAGESSENVVLHIPIFGDFVSNGIDLMQNPDDFFPSYVKSLDHFDEAVDIVSDPDVYNIDLKVGCAYLCDSFLLHRTRWGDAGLRGIISFPLRPKLKLNSSIYLNPLRESDYLNIEDWMKLGTNNFVVTDKKLEAYKGEDIAKKEYADKYSIVDEVIYQSDYSG